MRLSILSGIVAFVLWCVTDTSLKREHVRNCWTDGKLTSWRILSLVLVQIVLWTVTASLSPYWMEALYYGFCFGSRAMVCSAYGSSVPLDGYPRDPEHRLCGRDGRGRLSMGETIT
jgi:hypothetical protein